MALKQFVSRKRAPALPALCALLLAGAAFSADHPVKLLVGHLQVTGHAKLFIAKERGFFKEEGIDVELIAYSNSADGLAALRWNMLDVGVFGTVAPLVYIAAGTDIRIIGGIMGEDAYLVALPEKAEAINTISDLRGMNVATVRLSSGDAVLRGALDKAGLSWKSDLVITELSNPDAVLRAVEMRQADAGMIWGPFDMAATEKGMVIVMPTADLFPGHPCCRLVVTRERFDANRHIWPGFLRAIIKAERFASLPANHRQTIADIAKYVDLDDAHIEQGYFHGRLEQTSDPNVSGVLAIWRLMLESELIDSRLDPRDFIVSAPYREAFESLIKREPEEPYWRRVQTVFENRDMPPD